MAINELQEIKKLWEAKYPEVFISLWANQDSTHYYGKMLCKDISKDLTADSISALIGVGEEFLRKVRL